MTAQVQHKDNSSGFAMSGPAEAIDQTLVELDAELDWLTRLTPSNMGALWDAFCESNYNAMPALEYQDVDIDLEALRRKLLGLPVHDIDDPLIETLLIEKQREIDRQIELVRMRARDGIIIASIDLFGAVDSTLLDDALRILEQVPQIETAPRDSSAEDFVKAAALEMEYYHGQDPDFGFQVKVNPNSGGTLFTSSGDLYVAHDYRTAKARIDPLIQHEIGTHSVTWHNGKRQPLNVLRCGLPDYDALQEGLAVMGEYLSGYLPPERLRMLAARVVAADMAVNEVPVVQIFARLNDEFGFDKFRSFDTAIRAVRGGGLTKDALYLKGLVELLAYLHHGGDFETLFIGKFALKQLPILEKLLERGMLVPPALLPRYISKPRAVQRLENVRNMDITALYQEHPAP